MNYVITPSVPIKTRPPPLPLPPLKHQHVLTCHEKHPGFDTHWVINTNQKTKNTQTRSSLKDILPEEDLLSSRAQTRRAPKPCLPRRVSERSFEAATKHPGPIIERMYVPTRSHLDCESGLE